MKDGKSPITFDMTVRMVRASLIAACYVALTQFFQPFSFGQMQIRVAEALTLLPFVMPEAVPGVFVGCLIANIFGSPIGVADIFIGSGATLFAAWLTSKAPTLYWAGLPPVLVNALVVGGYLSYFMEVNFFLTVLYIGVGQAIACYALGVPLVRLLQKLRLVSGRGQEEKGEKSL